MSSSGIGSTNKDMKTFKHLLNRLLLVIIEPLLDLCEWTEEDIFGDYPDA